MQNQRPQQGKERSTDVETGKPQDMRDHRAPGESGTHADRSSQQAQQGDSKQSQQGGSGKTSAQQGGSTKDAPKQSTQQGTAGEQLGEGNYTASRHYNDGAKQFAESGKVDQAARAAAPRNAKEAREMHDAELAGKSRAKEEDPSLSPGNTPKPGVGPDE